MPQHSRREPRIMGPLPDDLILRNKLLPLLEDRSLIFEKSENTGQAFEFLLRLQSTESQAILSSRSCGDDPEFVTHLRNDADFIFRVEEPRNGVDRDVNLRRTGIEGSDKNTGIDENSHATAFSKCFRDCRRQNDSLGDGCRPIPETCPKVFGDVFQL